MNKFERKRLELIRLVLERGTMADACQAAVKWLSEKGSDKDRQNERKQALCALGIEVDGIAKQAEKEPENRAIKTIANPIPWLVLPDSDSGSFIIND